MSAKTPSADDMFLAAQWLDVYEGAEDAEACRRVAKWLNAQADAKQEREIARRADVSVKMVRAAIAKHSDQQLGKNMSLAKVHEIGPTCKKYKVEFAKEGGFWVAKIKSSVVLTYKQEGACKRNMERHLTAHNGYYARLYD